MYTVIKITKNMCKQLFLAMLVSVLVNNELCLGKDSSNLQDINKAQILQFWSRDPRFDTTKNPSDLRRRAERKMNRLNPIYHKNNRNHQGQVVNDQLIGGQSVKAEKDRKRLIQPINSNGKHRYSGNRNLAPERKDRKLHVKPGTANKGAKTAKDESVAPLRSGHRRKQKGTNTPKSLSTRMTPMMLMQQDEEPKKPEEKKEEKKEEDKENRWFMNRFLLSPFSIIDQFDKLLSEFPDVQVTKEILGRTAEYNNLLLLKLTKRGEASFRATDDKFINDEKKEKKIVFIVHALSAMGLRNLFSLTIESYLKQLLSYYVAHLDKFDIFLIPLANPDGYLRNKKRIYWNKNFSPQSDCSGVDLDRNFDVAWNTSVKEMSSCYPHYPGPRPFSEPESSAVRDVLHKYSHKIIAYLHVHAGTYNDQTFKGDAVLYPKGYTDVQTDDDKYIDLKGEVDEAIKNANFRYLSVTVDTLYNWYGKITGSSVDYAATVYGVPYAMELVMQSYQEPATVNFNRVLTGYHIELEYDALTQIWSRVIDVIFTNIWKKLEAKDD